ncbi:MAG: glycosyltransferase family 4 protein, partial [Solirubrobacteraceae bacterium]
NPRRRPPAGGGLGSLRNATADEWWTQIELPRLARAAGAEVIHHPLPARSQATRIPQVVTVHDLAFERLPEHFDRGFRRYARLVHRNAARRAAAVICVSRATAGSVTALWGVPERRIVVALHGPGQELVALARRRPRHFLYVGDDEPRKNLGMLLEAYRRYRDATLQPLELVLAGPAARAAIGAGVRGEPAPSAARLAELHAAAAALVHPALDEGFGLTPLEAMRLGTPVIAASAPAVSETCGDAARYVAPDDSAGLAAVMGALALDPQAQHELAERGRQRAAEFSWTRSAQRHLEAYSLAINR